MDLGLDLGPDRDDLELAGEDLRQAAQPPADVDLLEQLLLLLGRQPQRAGDQVRQDARVLDVRDHDLELLGEVRDLLDDVGERLLDVAHQRGQLRRVVDHVGRLGATSATRYGSVATHDSIRTRWPPWISTRSVPSGTRIMRATTPSTPTS